MKKLICNDQGDIFYATMNLKRNAVHGERAATASMNTPALCGT